MFEHVLIPISTVFMRQIGAYSSYTIGLAATSLIYEKWFRINIYYINQLVTTLIGSAVCPEYRT